MGAALQSGAYRCTTPAGDEVTKEFPTSRLFGTYFFGRHLRRTNLKSQLTNAGSKASLQSKSRVLATLHTVFKGRAGNIEDRNLNILPSWSQ